MSPEAHRRTLLRVMDASANRALEGLRVCEEIVRLCWDDPALFRRCRRLRHGVAAALRSGRPRREELLAARASRTDVGRAARARRIGTVEQLLIVNLQRAKEALRVLEECSRSVGPPRTAQFQRLRFALYDAERTLVLRVAALRHPRSRRQRRSRAA